jgi:hypothetical protein
MSTTSSEQDAHPKSLRLENARVFIVFYKETKHLARKLLQSAEASGNPTEKFIFVGTDGSTMPGFRNLRVDLPQGNPISVNRAFATIAELCYNNQDDFIMLDADCTFLKDHAIERISQELVRREGTVLGQPVWVHNHKFHGWTWNGNAAYRWFTWEKFNLKEEPIPDDYPFDLWLSKKFFQGHCAGTALYHNTLHKSQVKDLSFLDEAPHAVLHHSCLDGSVADCVVKKYLTHA